MTKIACIGSGNMGSALMKSIAGSEIGFADADLEKAQAAAAQMGAAVYSSNAAAAEKADFIFLAVKPQVMERVLEDIAGVLHNRLASGKAPVVVSMAAGWSIDAIQWAAGTFPAEGGCLPVARIMPNTPALVAKGVIALAVSPEVSPEKAAELETMLTGAGIVDRIEEQYLDAITALSGSGPAFVCLFIEALADGGVLAGLPRDKALRYAAQTVLGSAAMVLETGRHPGELKDMVCSPGGTTIAGITALETGAFRSNVIRAVEAAWKRAGELESK